MLTNKGKGQDHLAQVFIAKIFEEKCLPNIETNGQRKIKDWKEENRKVMSSSCRSCPSLKIHWLWIVMMG